MLNFLSEHLVTILAYVSLPIAYLFGGKQTKAIELKKNDSDALKSMQEVYDSFLVHFQKQMDVLLKEIADLKQHNNNLQLQFNEMFLKYSNELTTSKDWEKKHKELLKKHNELQVAHDQLKKEFDQLKKSIK